MLVNFIDMLEKAKKGNYAIPHFNINNLEWTKIILEKCEQLNIPVILGVSSSAAKYMGGWYVCSTLVNSLIRELNITVPVCLHVDHGSRDDCFNAIDNGFTSVMIDGSKYPIEENIKITKEVVDYAHKNNISVEAEIGSIGLTNEENHTYTNIDDCFKMCIETGIDALAPSIGNAHGIYLKEPNLNFELLKEINEKVQTPLVLHGGSTLSDNDIKKSIKFGISKININTDLQIAWKKGLTEFIKKNKEVYDPRKIILSGREEMNKKIEELVKLFETKSD